MNCVPRQKARFGKKKAIRAVLFSLAFSGSLAAMEKSDKEAEKPKEPSPLTQPDFEANIPLESYVKLASVLLPTESPLNPPLSDEPYVIYPW